MMLFFTQWLRENSDLSLSMPTVVACPAQLVEAWAWECQARFPKLKVAIMYEGVRKSEDVKLADRIIPTSFTTNLPKQRILPPWMANAFTPTKRNMWVVFTSYDTASKRTVFEVPDKTLPKIQVVKKDKKGNETTHWQYQTRWVHHMKNMYSLGILDEGHKCKNAGSEVHFSIKGLRLPLTVIVSATPMISSVC